MKDLEKIVMRVLNIEEDKIIAELSRNTTEEWDSFNHLLLINEIEKNLGIKFSISEVEKIKTFGQLQEIIAKK